jgi:hypothetical protein
MSIQLSLIKLAKSLVILMLVNGCQVKELTPFEKAKNPYAQLGVEGYMGAAMTACLGMPSSGPRIQKKIKNGTIVNDGSMSEQTDYFDCVDNSIMDVEENLIDRESK